MKNTINILVVCCNDDLKKLKEEIEDVKRFKGYLCTMDNGIVIDCADGTQIVLTIQTR